MDDSDKQESVPAEEAEVAGRVILIETRQGHLRVQIPADCRITFGPLVPAAPGGKKGYGPSIHLEDFSNQGGTALRIYQGSNKDHLYAVFRNVVSFRDASIQVEELVVDHEENEKVENATDGLQVVGLVKKQKKWVRRMD